MPFTNDRLRDRCFAYRMMARDALNRAATARDPVQKEELFNLALGWHALAVQIEESLNTLEQRDERLNTLEERNPFERVA